MNAKPKRPWSRRKRWWAAGLLWLVVAYPLVVGPLIYGSCRRWVGRDWPREHADMIALMLGGDAIAPGQWYRGYTNWWLIEGYKWKVREEQRRRPKEGVLHSYFVPAPTNTQSR